MRVGTIVVFDLFFSVAFVADLDDFFAVVVG